MAEHSAGEIRSRTFDRVSEREARKIASDNVAQRPLGLGSQNALWRDVFIGDYAGVGSVRSTLRSQWRVSRCFLTTELGASRSCSILVNRSEPSLGLVVRCSSATKPARTQLTGTGSQHCQPLQSLSRLMRCNLCRPCHSSISAGRLRRPLCFHPV